MHHSQAFPDMKRIAYGQSRRQVSNETEKAILVRKPCSFLLWEWREVWIWNDSETVFRAQSVYK